MHSQINQLRLASLGYGPGSEIYARLLLQSVNLTRSTQLQIRAVREHSNQLEEASRAQKRNATQVYQQGEQILVEAKLWLQGLNCQS